MFKFLASLLNTKRGQNTLSDGAKTVLQVIVRDLSVPPPYQRYSIVAGRGGRAVSVITDPSGYTFVFERKIGTYDVKDGKLLPSIIEDVKRRGGKRIAQLTLSRESMEDLHQILDHILAKERASRIYYPL